MGYLFFSSFSTVLLIFFYCFYRYFPQFSLFRTFFSPNFFYHFTPFYQFPYPYSHFSFSYTCFFTFFVNFVPPIFGHFLPHNARIFHFFKFFLYHLTNFHTFFRKKGP